MVITEEEYCKGHEIKVGKVFTSNKRLKKKYSLSGIRLNVCHI